MKENTPGNKEHKLWQGRTSGQVSDIMVRMGESIQLDIKLYRQDIRGSRAHATMLEKIGVLKSDELNAILTGLDQVEQEIEGGEMPLRPELEDIHTHVENRLAEIIGDPARKLHTGRSRNDQVAVDTHLFVREASLELKRRVLLLCETYLRRATESVDLILPGYTHLQVAQPVRLSHHLLAHFWSFLRDGERLDRAHETASRMPLGSGAMAGVNYPTDRELVREMLGFDSIYPNSMDAVSTRDHILDFLHANQVLAVHASRVSEEIILWNSVEFGFISLPDGLTTGSSIMPQKKNPDLAELIRGKTGRQISHMQSLLINLKGLPLTYNRDLQEDRFPLLDSFEQSLLILEALTAMVDGMQFHGEKMKASLESGYATATDLADALVQQKGVPFREAHHMVGKLVGLLASSGGVLGSASKEIRNQADPVFADDQFYFPAVDLSASADKKISQGGTARPRQLEQIALAKVALEKSSS